jgi:hypothetical protein
MALVLVPFINFKKMKKTTLFVVLFLITFESIHCFAQNRNNSNPAEFTTSFQEKDCSFTSTGRNAYFILEPGYQSVLEGVEKNDTTVLVVTVLKETKKIGDVETRVVEERESVNGNIVEISRNFFAFCKQTNSLFYFGEDVDIYKNGKVLNHEGAWLAGGNNKAGIGLPGIYLLGSRYYQEIAPGIGMDRGEIISISEIQETPAGKYTNILKIEETTPLDPKDISYKLYAPGVGLIKDGNLLLKKYGFLN